MAFNKKHSTKTNNTNYKHGGVYAISPDAENPYKIGSAVNFQHRLSNYLTCFPRGIHIMMKLVVTNMPDLMLTFGGCEAECWRDLRKQCDIPFMQKIVSHLEKSIQRKLNKFNLKDTKSLQNKHRRNEWFTCSYEKMLVAFLETLQEYAYAWVSQGKKEETILLRVDVYNYASVDAFRKKFKQFDNFFVQKKNNVLRIVVKQQDKRVRLRVAPPSKRKVCKSCTMPLGFATPDVVKMKIDLSTVTPVGKLDL